MSRQDISSNLTAAARGPANSSSNLRRRSSLLKRDSAVSLGHAGSRSDARRVSVRRSFQSSEAAFIEDDLAEFLAEQPAAIMGPVYRLVRQFFLPPSTRTRLHQHHNGVVIQQTGAYRRCRQRCEERPPSHGPDISAIRDRSRLLRQRSVLGLLAATQERLTSHDVPTAVQIGTNHLSRIPF